MVQLHPGPPLIGKNMRIIYLICFLLITGISPSYASGKDSKSFIVQEFSSPIVLPEVPFKNVDGKDVFLEQFDGNVLILNFWASWCSICINELPQLDALQKKFKKKPLRVINISQDFKGIEAVKAFYNQYNIKHLGMYIDDKNKLFNALGISVIPTSIIVNKDGLEVARISGPAMWEDVEIQDIISQQLSK
jgi:thiol-disulfide isomerase/thioredoxin